MLLRILSRYCQDFTVLDHIAHFDRERIPERVVHAKGAGAFGYFEVRSTQCIRNVDVLTIFEHVNFVP